MNSVIIEGLAFILPLFIMGVGGIYSERSGITNLALEGFQGFGAFVGALSVVVTAMFAPSIASNYGIYIALIFAMIGGTLFSLIHALLCIKFKANQVISGVVMNILSISVTVFLTRAMNQVLFNTPSNKFQLAVSTKLTVPFISKIPVLGAFFTDLYPYEIVIVLVGILAFIVLYKTRFGMHLRACGDNPYAADTAGINVANVRYKAVMVSGALSGLAGMSFAYSISANFSPGIYMGFGYLSIAALIFGNWEIIPTLGAAFIFGMFRSFGFKLAQIFSLDSSFGDISMMLPYVLTLVLLVFFSKNNRAPRALGQIYDQGKR